MLDAAPTGTSYLALLTRLAARLQRKPVCFARCMPLHIYQILNHYTSRQDLDPGFDVLDNSANERPDWFEYWPISKFLLNESLDEDAFYGFLSPKFKQKTNLSAAAVRDFIGRSADETDVFLFSPSIHNSAYFLQRVRTRRRRASRASRASPAQLFERIDPGRGSRSRWCPIRETPCIRIISSPSRDSGGRGSRSTSGCSRSPRSRGRSARRANCARRPPIAGGSNVQMKIFVMERVATWLLTRDRSFVARARDPFAARARIYKLPVAIVCDALKIAYADAGPRPIQGCVPAGAQSAQILESADQARRPRWGCAACGRRCARSDPTGSPASAERQGACADTDIASSEFWRGPPRVAHRAHRFQGRVAEPVAAAAGGEAHAAMRWRRQPRRTCGRIVGDGTALGASPTSAMRARVREAVRRGRSADRHSHGGAGAGARVVSRSARQPMRPMCSAPARCCRPAASSTASAVRACRHQRQGLRESTARAGRSRRAIGSAATIRTATARPAPNC